MHAFEYKSEKNQADFVGVLDWRGGEESPGERRGQKRQIPKGKNLTYYTQQTERMFLNQASKCLCLFFLGFCFSSLSLGKDLVFLQV